ncbi:MAG TPA: 30S ribosomal protein S10 [Fusobacteria bacterium]|nr:30S ribosomal protein S10 [Fusobacteriota bacterium]|tara:strand:+ start:23547 stop:23858 length:312 start_codon:yes stop_codon:yes gene_type:complete
MKKESFRIYLSSYDHKVLDDSAKRIIEAVEKSGASVAGPVPLPTKIKKYTVLRSPHKHKDARNQYEQRIHKRMIEVSDSNHQSISSLSSFSLPAGVGIEIKQI